MLLPIVLIVTFLQFPDMPPVHMERFETNSECKQAAAKLDNSTRVVFQWRCLDDET